MHFRFPLIDLGFMTILTFSLVGAAIEAATLHPATVSLLASAGGLG